MKEGSPKNRLALGGGWSEDPAHMLDPNPNPGSRSKQPHTDGCGKGVKVKEEILPDQPACLLQYKLGLDCKLFFLTLTFCS